MEREPIFIGWTRSFWAGILPILLIVVDISVQALADAAVGPPVAGLIARGFDIDPDLVEQTMLRLTPLFALIIAQQRAGAARPYTIDPRARQ